MANNVMESRIPSFYKRGASTNNTNHLAGHSKSTAACSAACDNLHLLNSAFK